MTPALAAVIAALITALVSLTTILITTRSERRRAERLQILERERDREKKRIQYLDPLLVSAGDLLAKINRLRDELTTREEFWKNTFREVKDRDRTKRDEFAFWCNGFGAGAVTTLYVTTVYFARASRIRSELPFIQLGAYDDQALLERLTEVRNAFGGEHNLWVEIQDSLGEYITAADGRIMNYRGFCTQLIDSWDHIWFTRLIDFYRDVHLKKLELERIATALQHLIDFAKTAAAPKTPLTKKGNVRR